ncbi:MAG TPA: SpoIIE family protein phosphatase [Motilibacteraceae bacterium]|nr:SpoIIE family protein phosphatase [Motilibacteraceae bacterium]
MSGTDQAVHPGLTEPAAPSTTAELFEATDWAATALGRRERWVPELSAVVRTVLSAPLPAALVLGPDFTLVYNDAYAQVIGAKHPVAFGRPAPEVLAENWEVPGHGDVVRQVLVSGEGYLDRETVLPVQRQGPDGPVELVHFARAYTPVRDADGQVLGVLSMITESTAVARALAQVAEVAARLSSALSVDDVAREALRHAVDVLGADHARVALVEGSALRLARRSRMDEHDVSLERLPPLWSRIRADATLPSARVTSTGEALWLQGDLSGFTDLMDEPGVHGRLRSVASVPVRSGTVQGALALGWEQARGFSAAERDALSTVGTLVAQAMARAVRFDEQRGNAETLQRSMLPADLPHVPGVSIGARYEPSAPGTSAGGDFYDAFTLADGRVVLAIGDVVGHGVLAAAVMGQARAGLRVLALADPDPVKVLSGLDPFVASLGPEVFVTACVGVLDPRTGDLELATAGHLAPLVRRRSISDGSSESGDYVVVPAGPPLGLAGERGLAHVRLGEGDVLLLFTDGLVEVGGQDLGVGLDELRRLAVEHGSVTDPRRLCSLLLDHLGTGDDDIALMAVAMDAGERRTASLAVPAEASAPGEARRWATRTLGDWGLDEDSLQIALLALNELTTNALLHARSGSRVELDLDDARLLVLVTDAGLTTALAPQSAEPNELRGRGLALVEAITTAWGSERTSRGTTVWFEVARP